MSDSSVETSSAPLYKGVHCMCACGGVRGKREIGEGRPGEVAVFTSMSAVGKNAGIALFRGVRHAECC